MRPYPDILVIGLGPAGSCAAYAAAEAGANVLAVDKRSRAGHPVQCAEFVPAMLGQDVPALDPVARQRIHTMITKVEDDAPDLKDRFPGHIIDREAFDAALVDRAVAAGADCRFGVPVDAIAPNGTVTLAGGVILTPRAIIGADGPRSPTGKAIGRRNSAFVETRQITVPLREPHSATDIFLAAEIEGGYGWLFPKDDVANLGVGVVPAAKARLKPLLDALRAALLEEGRIGEEILGHTGGAIPVGGMLDPVSALNTVPVLLAGDAAGLTNPVTGAGISAAVASGAMAGQAAADWLAGEKDALDDYADDLTDLFKPALDRALKRRREILDSYASGHAPSRAALRRGWIAYPEYWAA
jgi:digeranylgeranylglycerophospholipid reductase